MNQKFKDRISWWQLMAKKERNPWISFVLYYFIFDAYLSEGSQSGSDRKKLKWFLDNDNPLKTSLADSWKTKLLPEAVY